MMYQKFRGINFSKICFGCEPLGGFNWGNVNLSQIEKAISISIDLGINFFDTADVYGLGLSEKRLSRILGEKRHEMIIATKGGVSWKKKGSKIITSRNISAKYIRLAVEDSLRRLRLDILPVYFIHWPDNKSDILETFSLLARLQEEQKIGLIGCSNFSYEEIQKALKVSDISLIQAPLNIIDGMPDKKILKLCTKKDIKIVAYNVLYSGLLSGKYNEDSKFLKNDRRSRLKSFSKKNLKENFKIINKLKEKSEKTNQSLLKLSLDWPFKNENVLSLITGIKNSKQIIENVMALKK